MTDLADTYDLYGIAVTELCMLDDVPPTGNTTVSVALLANKFLAMAKDAWAETWRIESADTAIPLAILTETRNRLIARIWDHIETREDAARAEAADDEGGYGMNYYYDRKGYLCRRPEYDTYRNAN